jgi:hypothetical protein
VKTESGSASSSRFLAGSGSQGLHERMAHGRNPQSIM